MLLRFDFHRYFIYIFYISLFIKRRIYFPKNTCFESYNCFWLLFCVIMCYLFLLNFCLLLRKLLFPKFGVNFKRFFGLRVYFNEAFLANTFRVTYFSVQFFSSLIYIFQVQNNVWFSFYHELRHFFGPIFFLCIFTKFFRPMVFSFSNIIFITFYFNKDFVRQLTTITYIPQRTLPFMVILEVYNAFWFSHYLIY